MKTPQLESHYDYLDRELPGFLLAIGVKCDDCLALIGAHGDKCYTYREKFPAMGLDFGQGVAIYLLTYLYPFTKEVRETDNGWVYPHKWIEENTHRFIQYLPKMKVK